MPRFQLLDMLTATGGYRPVASVGGADTQPNVLYRGSGYWLRPGGRLKPVKGSTQISATNIGARIYAIDIYRGSIAGGLVSGALPKESLVRYQQSALFFLSENTGQQVYLNESTSSPFTLTGVTTSSMAGKLRVALQSGTTFTAYDAGLQAPSSVGTIATEAGGSKAMDGKVSIVACQRRTAVDVTSNPSPASVQTLSSGSNNRIRVTLGTLTTGADAWWFGGTDWGRGDFGPWKLIREVRVIPTGTFGLTNGSAAFTGIGTRFLRDLRPGDQVTLDGSNYLVATVTSDTAGTLTTNFTGTTASYSGTMVQVVLDYRNGELTDLIEFDNDPPPIMDGILNFNNVLFGWKNNTFYAAKIGNPEAWPAVLARSTMSGGNIIQALGGDAKIYLLTTNSLEVITFTQNPDDPFLLRQVWAFGFTSPSQAVVAEGLLYAAIGVSAGVKIVRTRVDDSPDLEFSANIESDLAGWNVSNVVMAVAPAEGAVLAVHNDGSNTTLIPYMLQLGAWSLPQALTGRVKDAATVANTCDFIVYDGTNFRAYQFEGGSGSGIAKYVCWPFLDREGIRQTLKRFKFIGDADTLYVYVITPGGSVPDVTNTGAALASYTLIGSLTMAEQIQTNVQNAQGYAIRIDSDDSDSEIVECGVWGLLNPIGR